MKTPSFSTILIANRSEVAARIQATAHAHGLRTICLYAADDTAQAHLSEADEVYQLSGTGGSAYLNQDEILTIAQKAGANAIHPGYGFLSEVPAFAQRVTDVGITFIGPTPETIELLGDKGRARMLAEHCNVPVVPGASFHSDERPSAQQYAEQIGYPILLKATGGGGGRGMAQVLCSEEFPVLWQRISDEGRRAFHSEHIVVEKYVENPRHIEVQIAGDGKSVIHLFERDCSTQRRRQKIIEEAPASHLPAALRMQLCDAAVRIARSVNYRSIGTVEFIVAEDHSFYFLEVNTRLQVEHGVTELITGIDLVGIQLDVAARKPLSLSQADITVRGHAIQCRIYAEDPTADFTPSTGIIFAHSATNAPFTRLDHSLELPHTVSGLYDPMLSKVLTYGPTRNDVLKRLQALLRTYRLGGITTNIAFLQHILAHPLFQNNQIHTQSMPDLRAGYTHEPVDLGLITAQISAALHEEEITDSQAAPPSLHNTWKEQQWN
jgi:acetyl/propionyl-CoA carboxylase alpha subunit